MSRRFCEPRLLVATHNLGKLREITELLAGFAIQVVAPTELQLAEPLETGATFIENAELKAQAAATASGLPALADDSGLCVDALDGAPGVHSARWGGPKKDFALAMQRVHQEVAARGLANPRANMVCVLSLAWPDAHVESFSGTVLGSLVWPPRGENGSGYEPIFLPDGETRTFAEMSDAQKQTKNARAAAFAKLIESCFTSYPSKTV